MRKAKIATRGTAASRAARHVSVSIQDLYSWKDFTPMKRKSGYWPNLQSLMKTTGQGSMHIKINIHLHHTHLPGLSLQREGNVTAATPWNGTLGNDRLE